MTYLLPQSEVLGFLSDDLNSSCSLHDAFFEESSLLDQYNDVDYPIGFPLSSDNEFPFYDKADQSYEVVTEANTKSEKEGLKLKLRMSNSLCLGASPGLGAGSVGSSPNDVADDCGILNVEEFLNLPSNDFVTIEESKQVPPSPAYSSLSSGTDPSPYHSSFSPAHPVLPPEKTSDPPSVSNPPSVSKTSEETRSPQSPSPVKASSSRSSKCHAIGSDPVLKRKITPSSTPPSPKSSRVCKVVPVERSPVDCQDKENENKGKRKATEAKAVNNKFVLKKYYEQEEILIQNREQEIIEVEKKDSVSKVKQGTVIGSMKRGPRMFGVRYGPCDRPALDEEELLTSSTPPYDVASKYVTNMPSSDVSPSAKSQMVMNQQIKLNANSSSPKIPDKVTLQTPFPSPGSSYSTANKRSLSTSATVRKQLCYPIPKAKIELPPCNKQAVNGNKCKRKQQEIKSRTTDLFYQNHLYCSIDKPLFETDPAILKISQSYQLMLNTYIALEAQRITVLKDLDKLENLKKSAVKRPYKFIKQLKKGDVVFPQRLDLAKIPEVSMSYKSKDIDVCNFKASSGHAVSKQSDEFAKTTRLKEQTR